MEKDCEIIFCNKQTYQFSSKDLAKALEWAQDKKVWVFKTPWGVFQPMPEEEFDIISDAVFGPTETELPTDI